MNPDSKPVTNPKRLNRTTITSTNKTTKIQSSSLDENKFKKKDRKSEQLSAHQPK